MDKDVEVSKDQNTVVIDGTRYQSKSQSQLPEGRLAVCEECDIRKANTTKYSLCSYVPCGSDERKDKEEVVFKVQL
ncbi:hypothetical protein P5_0046 [Aeromonas phage P5]|nr:hypothetical protein P5_0046 [Aeromonas phage P5]